jgi:hypothetical protein
MIDRAIRSQIETLPYALSHHEDATIRAVIQDLKKAQIELARILQNRTEARTRYQSKGKPNG